MKQPYLKKIFLLCLIIYPLFNFSQTVSDALRYSFQHYGGSARHVSMSGSFESLGGDISTLGNNPGGIGVFRRSEFSLSTGVTNTKTISNFNGNKTGNNKLNFDLNHIGYLGTFKYSSSHDLRSIHIGLNYNKNTNFNRNTNIKENDSEFSILDLVTTSLNNQQVPIDSMLGQFSSYQFFSAQAYRAGLIDTVNGNKRKYASALGDSNIVNIDRTLKESGSIGEWQLSFGVDYKDILFIGMTFGFPSNKYDLNKKHQENISSTDSVEQLTFKEKISSEGSGSNFKVGFLFKPVYWLRIGGAYNSGTTFTQKEEYSTRFLSEFVSGNKKNSGLEFFKYKYKVKTPARYKASISTVFEQNGLISYTAEFVNYQKAKLKPKGDNVNQSFFENQNAIIDLVFENTWNHKVGVEWRMSPFKIRGGFSFFEAPVDNDFSTYSMDRITYSLGAGVKLGKYYIDLAMSLTRWNRKNYLFGTLQDLKVKTTTSRFRTLLTGGVKF
ncbi:MAG: OmpP1/FadL family transporter [Flavobacteriales bacterium]